jgi:hypothetical protein
MSCLFDRQDLGDFAFDPYFPNVFISMEMLVFAWNVEFLAFFILKWQ